MTTIHVHADAPVPPQRILGALTDFIGRRPAYWPNLDPGLFRVHARGDTWAEVTEGAAFAGGIWERGRYDWSTPGVVRLDVTSSNAFAPGGYGEYHIRPDGPGRSSVDLTVYRRPATAKGRLLTLLLALFGRRIFRADLSKTLKTLASDHGPAPAPGH
jgi:hypothetical protein